MVLRCKLVSFLILFLLVCSPLEETRADTQIESTFVSKEQQTEADLYLKTITDQYSNTPLTPKRLAAAQVSAGASHMKGDTYGTIYECQKILGQDPKDVTAWLLIAATGIKNESYHKDKAISAAILAHRFAQDPKDRALALYFLSQMVKPPSPFLKKELENTPPQKLIERFLKKVRDYPAVFTVFDVETQEKADVGAVSLVFSKPLKKVKAFRYEDYVAVSPQCRDLSIVAKGNKLILTGLSFGADYNLTLKKGLAGENGYQLTEDTVIPVGIEHRKPFIQFRERGYILSSKAPQLLPLKAINVPTTQIKVVRLSLPNLLNQVHEGSLIDQLSSWRFESLEDTHAELIAEGSFDCSDQVDQTAVKGLPIEKIIGKRLEEGVYIFQASVKGTDTYDEGLNSTQWLVVSDIGLSTLSGPDGLHITARSLATAQLLRGVKVVVLARNGQVLATQYTDRSGSIHINQNLLSGKGSMKPALIYAQRNEQDFTFINYQKEGFDLSDRGSKGRSPLKIADCYVYTERGVYRPGDTVKIIALVRDKKGKALKAIPLIFKIFRPDHLEVAQKVTQDVGNGGHTLEFPTQPSNHGGTWTIRTYLDPKGDPIGTTTFTLEDFIPPRIHGKATFKALSAHIYEPIQTEVEAQYFYGAPGGGLKVSGILELIEEKEPFQKWKDYNFGLVEEEWSPLKFTMEEQVTDPEGRAILESKVTTQPSTTKVLSAALKGSVYESTGRPISVSEKVLFWHQPFAIGIHPDFQNDQVPEGGKAQFQVIAVNKEGELQDVADLDYTLYSEERTYTWYRKGSDWRYEANVEAYPIKEGKLSLSKEEPSPLSEDVEYGSYRLEVRDNKTGITSSFQFHSGWQGASSTPDRPDMLELTLDKPSYSQGDNIQLIVNTPFEGYLSVSAVDNQTLKTIHQQKIQDKKTALKVSVNSEMAGRPGFYLLATVYKAGVKGSEKMPGRAIGLIWVDLQKGLNKLDLTLRAPQVVRPETSFDVEVVVPKAQKNLRVVVAAVDEALLQLTNYQTPDPFGHFFAQSAFAYTLRDSYASLINPFGTKPGTFNVGGGGGEVSVGLSDTALTTLAERTFKTVSLFSGVVDNFITSKESGESVAKIPLTLPDFSGELRLMAVAWDGDTMASASEVTLVRDPVETYISLPRFLAPQDEATVTVDVQNLTGEVGTFQIRIDAEGELDLTTPFAADLTLQPGESVHLPLTLKALTKGKGTLKLHLEGTNDLRIDKTWSMDVRSPVFVTTNRSGGMIQPGDTLTLDRNTFAEFVPGTESLELNVGHMPIFGKEKLVSELRAYPYGCLEQLTSRLAAEFYSGEGSDTPQIREALSCLAALQQYDGAFSLWSSGDGYAPWLSLYAIDLLTRFQNQHDHRVMLQRGVGWLKGYINKTHIKPRQFSEHTYAHYLLAREKLGTLGKLKYFVDLHGTHIKRRSDQAFIGAAFAYYGDVKSAGHWFEKSAELRNSEDDKSIHNRPFFESDLSEMEILLTLLAEVSQGKSQIIPLSQELLGQVSKQHELNTFEKGWMLRVADTLSSLQKPVHLNVNKEDITSPKGYEVVYEEGGLEKATTLMNEDDSPVFYYYSATGEPQDEASIPNSGFELNREVFTLEGKPVDLSTLKPGEACVVVLTGKLLVEGSHEVLILDLLPAGFEFEGAGHASSFIEEKLPWLEDLSSTSRVEKRDDRYFAVKHMDRPGTVKLAYLVRAIKPGSYAYPAAVVESMYRPEYSARTPSQRLTIHP